MSSKVLMVGAGGIGCELIKNLVLSGFTEIHVVDLDTIDLSNLNRQFLFNKSHIKQSKAHIAKQAGICNITITCACAALKFNPLVKIESYFASIFDDQFSLDFFKSFDIILNALDNLAARRHVNMMACATNVPLVESGTAGLPFEYLFFGYLGQITVHHRGVYQCFDCEPKPTPKTYPVCTIRSTPSTPIHCIVWAKSYLMGLLYGASENEDEMVKKDAKQDETEAHALKNLKKQAGTPEYPQKVFEMIYHQDIVRLLSMDDLWKTREKPKPLAYSKDYASAKEVESLSDMDREQNVWSLGYNARVFTKSLNKLQKSYADLIKKDPDASLIFDKDDDDALDFVTASSNLRSLIFNIPQQSRFMVKEMAGNIIPAIATTNAIIAGMIVLAAMKILDGKIAKCKNVCLVYLVYACRGRSQILSGEQLMAPNSQCGVCSIKYLQVCTDLEKTTIKELVHKIALETFQLDGEVSLEQGGRLLYDADFEDNAPKSLAALKLRDGGMLYMHVDNDDGNDGVTFALFLKQVVGLGIQVSGDITKCIKRKRPIKEEHETEEQESSKRANTMDVQVSLDDADDILILD